MKLVKLCAVHGVDVNKSHVTTVAAIGGGALLAKLEALVEKFGPSIAPDMPTIIADYAAGNWLAATELVFADLTKAA